MVEKKTPAKTEEQKIIELEARIAKLEACKCPCTKVMGKICKDGKCPTQDEVRDWVKANPFLALGIAVIATALIVGIIF